MRSGDTTAALLFVQSLSEILFFSHLFSLGLSGIKHSSYQYLNPRKIKELHVAMVHALFARARVSSDSGSPRVALTLVVVPQGRCAEPVRHTLCSLLEEAASLPEGAFMAREVTVGGLRVVRRQRWGKHLQFLKLRCETGEDLEAILRPELASGPSAEASGRKAPECVVVTEEGTHRYLAYPFADEHAAREATNRLWCNWVLFAQAAAGGGWQEVASGGVGFSRPRIRARVRDCGGPCTLPRTWVNQLMGDADAAVAPPLAASPPAARRTQTDMEGLSCALGDCVTLTGLVERSRGRLSLHPRRLAVDESFVSLFGPTARFHDASLDATPHYRLEPQAASGGAVVGTAMIQCAGSHAVRLHEYLRAVMDARTVACVSPVPGAAGKDVRRDERCLLLSCADARAVCEAVRADPHASRVVHRWYVLGHVAPTLAAACDGVLALLRARAGARGGGDPTPSVRVHAYPKGIEAMATERLRASGEALPTQKASYLASVVYTFGEPRGHRVKPRLRPVPPS